jgi:hypothetical protein
MNNCHIFIPVEKTLLLKFRERPLGIKPDFCSKTYLGGGILRQVNNINSYLGEEDAI